MQEKDKPYRLVKPLLVRGETFYKIRAAFSQDHGVGDTYTRCSNCNCGDIRNLRLPPNISSYLLR